MTDPNNLLYGLQTAGQPAVKSSVNLASPVQTKRKPDKGAHSTPARRNRGRGRRYLRFR